MIGTWVPAVASIRAAAGNRSRLRNAGAATRAGRSKVVVTMVVSFVHDPGGSVCGSPVGVWSAGSARSALLPAAEDVGGDLVGQVGAGDQVRSGHLRHPGGVDAQDL